MNSIMRIVKSVTVISIILYDCSIPKKMGDSFAKGLYAILPTKCEYFMIEEISNNRKDSIKMPIGKQTHYVVESMDSVCMSTIDSIYTYRHNSDSIDLRFRKRVDMNGQDGYIRKQYRIKYLNDSINIIYLPNDSIVKKTKANNRQKRTKDQDIRIEW